MILFIKYLIKYFLIDYFLKYLIIKTNYFVNIIFYYFI